MGVFMASTFGAELDLICNSNSFKSVDDLAKTFKTLRKRYQTDLNIDWDDVDRRLKELLPKSTKEDFLGIIHCFSGPLFQNVANTEHFMGNEMEAIFFFGFLAAFVQQRLHKLTTFYYPQDARLSNLKSEMNDFVKNLQGVKFSCKEEDLTYKLRNAVTHAQVVIGNNPIDN